MARTAKPAPWHLWLVGILGLLFNSVGVVDYVMTQARNDSYMSRFPAEQLAILYGLPMWLVIVWGLAVGAGAFGALLLLLRRGLAVPVLLISLGAMTVTALHSFLSAIVIAPGGAAPGRVHSGWPMRCISTRSG